MTAAQQREPLVPVILSGGSGTRLWPLSREQTPKQLLPLTGARSLLQETVLRAWAVSPTPPLLVCNEQQRFQVAEQCRGLGGDIGAILLEPCPRNTAPAIALAAREAIARHGEDTQLLVLPADQVVHHLPTFVDAARTAAQLASTTRAVTFGIRPTRPETGFGYLRSGHRIEGFRHACELDAFVEKPDRHRAEAFLAEGRYYWNGGIFLFPARWLLEQIQRLEPEMARSTDEAWRLAQRDQDFVRIDPRAFERSPSKSIDYAVMERVEGNAMVILDAGWNDVGSFTALWQLGEQDAQGVVAMGDVLNEGSRDCYLRAESRLLAVVGVRDLVVVETADAVLVAHRDAAQDVKTIVDRLRQAGRNDLLAGVSAPKME